MKHALLWSLLVGVALGADSFICPEDESTGVFSDSERCDIYWECFRGEATKVKCADGFAFDPSRIQLKEPCDYIFNVDCVGRELLGAPKGFNEECPRLNGIYPAKDLNDCNHYISCVDGTGTIRDCSPGLHFNNVTKSCTWPAEANRGACTRRQSLHGVTCNPQKSYFTESGQKIVHPNFAHPEDCELFITCKNGEVPSVARCDTGLVFNNNTRACDDPTNVPECFVYDSEPETLS